MKMKMMMSEQKDPGSNTLPQLDSEQRKNEEEEEEPSSKPIQTLPLAFFKRRRKRKSKKEEKIEFRELGWTRINTCCTRFMFVFFLKKKRHS